MKKTLITAGLVLSLIFSVSAKNKYMVPGTDQYESTTTKVVGTWKITSIDREHHGEQMGSIYSSGEASFLPPKKAGKDGEFIVRFSINDSLKTVRGDAWRKDEEERVNDATFKISKYDVVYKGDWSIKNGENIQLDLEATQFDIAGKGIDLEEFIAGEIAVLGTVQGIGGGGLGFAGMIISKSVKSGSGIDDYVPTFPEYIEFKFDGNKLLLKDDISNGEDDLNVTLEK